MKIQWAQLREHAHQIEFFRRSVQRGRLGHAYLLAGPDGIGKRTFAQILAAGLLCERNAAELLQACGRCDNCQRTVAGTHPDLLMCSRPEGKSELPLEAFIGSPEKRGREGLCFELSLRPMAGDRRIAIIDDASFMNVASANALLKTLEEPPDRSLMILIAGNANGLLPTIRSRCQLVQFGPLPAETLAELLVENETVESRAEAEIVAGLSDGSLTVAEQLVDPALRVLRERLYRELSLGPGMNPLRMSQEIIDGIEAIGGDAGAQRNNAGWMIRFAIEFLRSALRHAVLNETGAIQQVPEFVSRFSSGTDHLIDLFDSLIHRCIAAIDQLDRRTAAPLCLEVLFDDLSRLCRPGF